MPSTPRNPAALWLLTLAAMAAGCGDAAAPEFTVPAMDPSLDPDDLVVGEYIATPCTDNEELEGREEWQLVDIFFGRSEHDPVDGPKSSDVALVEHLGGIVVYRFNVPAVRAWMRLDRVPALVRSGFWITVRDVPDPTRYDHPVFVGFSSRVEEGIQRFWDLGGRIDYRYTSFDAIAGPLPDRSIPALRAQPGVDYVEPAGILCLAGDGPGQPASRSSSSRIATS